MAWLVFHSTSSNCFHCLNTRMRFIIKDLIKYLLLEGAGPAGINDSTSPEYGVFFPVVRMVYGRLEFDSAIHLLCTLLRRG